MAALLIWIASYLGAPQSGPPEPICDLAEQTNKSVDSIEGSKSLDYRISTAGDLVVIKLASVKGENVRCQRAIAVALARFLPDPTLRDYAAIGLYRLGPNARVVKLAIHAAYLKQADLMRPHPNIPFRVGPDFGILESLRCLDKFINTGFRDKALCARLEEAIQPRQD